MQTKLVTLRIKNKIYSLAYELYRSTFGNKNCDKFVVITRSRTGSNYLISLLNSHKNISAYGEVFARLENKKATKQFNKIFRKKSLTDLVGFKMFYYHPLNLNDDTVWNLLIKNKNIKIIHLIRKNLLKVHISRLKAKRDEVWFVKNKNNRKTSLKETKVKIDLPELIKDFEKTNNYIAKTKTNFNNHTYLEIFYENLLNDRNKEINKITEFLNVESMKLSSTLKKQNNKKLNEIILNYDEVEAYLLNTKYKSFLNN